jgi:acetyl esterase/lipase
MRQFHDTPMWSRPAAEKSWEWYLGDAHGRDDVSPYAAPARATNLAGLPPAYVSTMEFDPLRDEGIRYAMDMLAAGVSVELHSFPGTFHGSAIMTGSAVHRREAVERMTVWRRALGLDAG